MNPSQGARLTAGPPRDPEGEIHQANIQAGEQGREANVLPFDSDSFEKERLFLMKQADPDKAYQLIKGKPSRLLDHHGEGWGEICFGVILTRIEPSEALQNDLYAFQAPDPDNVEFVAIKKLNKRNVQEYLSRGGHEDPYIEVSRMQELGDGIHVLQCIEALEDDEFLFIVTPYCSEGSLMESIPFSPDGEGLPEAEALGYFRNMLEILLYLERHGICHHDISPDNFLLFNGRLVLFDFAMSFRIPRDKESGRRLLVKPQGVFGTMATQAPELFFNRTPFDGIGVDLWSVVVTLYSLLTGHLLYRLPHPDDILFRFYILADGLHPGLNERAVEVLESTFQPGQHRDHQNDLMAHAMANLNIGYGAMEVLRNVLTFNPANRWTLAQTVESAWVQGIP